MLEAEFEQFQTDIIERVRELWPGYTRLLIDNPDKHIKGILQSFRSDPDANPRHCVANMCVGDVQAGKTPIIALTAIVLHLICCDRRIVDQPHLVVIEDRNSSRDAMIPKLTRLLSDYQDGRIPVGLPKEAVTIQRGGGVLVTARTAHQIGQATLDEVDDGEEVSLPLLTGTAYVVLDEADNILGSCEGKQEFEKAVDRLLGHRSTRGATFLSATIQLPYGYLVRCAVQNPNDLIVKFEMQSSDGYVPATDPRRTNYVGFADAQRYDNSYFKHPSSNDVSMVVNKEADNTCDKYLQLCAEVNAKPYACLMARMCSGVNLNTRSVNMTDHAVRMSTELQAQMGDDLRDAFQLVVHCSHGVYEGCVGIRAFGPTADAKMQQLIEGTDAAVDIHGFVQLEDLKDKLIEIETDAEAHNPTYVRTIKIQKNGNWPRMNTVQLPLVLYYIRSLFEGIPLYIIGNTVLGRSLSVVSVDPFTDNTDNIRVMSCITHVALHVPDNSSEFINKNHSDTVQMFLRFATTLREKFHNVHGFTDIPVLTQRDVWNVVESSLAFNDWMYQNQTALPEALHQIQHYAKTQYEQDDDNRTVDEVENDVLERAAETLSFDANLRHFFGGRNWGHRGARLVTGVMARFILKCDRRAVVIEHGEDSAQVVKFDKDYEDEMEQGVLEKKRKYDGSTPSTNKRARTTAAPKYDRLTWYTARLDTLVRQQLSPEAQVELTQMLTELNTGAGEITATRAHLHRLPLPSYQLIDLLDQLSQESPAHAGSCAILQEVLTGAYDADPGGIPEAIYWHDWKGAPLTRTTIDTYHREKYDKYLTGGSTATDVRTKNLLQPNASECFPLALFRLQL